MKTINERNAATNDPRFLNFDEILDVQREASRLQGELIAEHARLLGRKISDVSKRVGQGIVRSFSHVTRDGAKRAFADFRG